MPSRADVLLRAGVDQRVARDVDDQILVLAAGVVNLQHQVQPASLLGDHPAHARVVVARILHVEHRHEIRRERRLSWIKRGQLAGEVDVLADALEVLAERGDGADLGPEVGATLGGVGLLALHRGGDLLDVPVPSLTRHGQPRFSRGGDGQV